MKMDAPELLVFASGLMNVEELFAFEMEYFDDLAFVFAALLEG